jgi:6-phosphogluconolactonase
MPREIEKIIMPDLNKLSEKGAEIFYTSAKETLRYKEFFAVAISGGSTPRTMHRILAQEPYLSKTPWHRAHLFWVDERMVPFDHPHSNFGTAREDLINQVPIPPDQVHPMPTMTMAGTGAVHYEDELRNFFRQVKSDSPQFDLVTLGVGNDGHIASLFPGQDSTASEHWVLSVKGGSPNLYRITLTYVILNNAKRILFVVSGKEKAKIVKTLFGNRQSLLPANRIKPLNGKITWLLDEAAASLL